MIQLSRLFENHFDDPEVSADELRDFAEDFLGKLSSLSGDPTNGPAYAAIHAEVKPAFDAFDTALSVRATQLASQQSGTLTKDDALRLFKARVRQREGRVRDKFERGSAAYIAFYPAGMADYNRAKLAQVPALMDRYIAAATKYSTELGPELKAEFEELRQKFATARESQLESKGEVSEARQAVADTRKALGLSLNLQILELAKQHLGQPERAATFFDQSLLEDPTRSQKDEEAPATP